MERMIYLAIGGFLGAALLGVMVSPYIMDLQRKIRWWEQDQAGAKNQPVRSAPATIINLGK